MGKKVFAVVLDDKGQQNVDAVGDRLSGEYGAGNVFRYTDGVIYVAVPETATTETTANVAKIKGVSRDTSGVVFKLNSAYSGYTDKSLWEWLSDAQDS